MPHAPRSVTVESVTAGHPDKVCDQISDAILDAALSQDPRSRVAIEAFGSHGRLTIGGEITTHARLDYAAIAQRVYHDIGYHDPLDVSVQIAQQSPEIAAGVDQGGAGDQGIMYGFATDETPELMPRAYVQAIALAKRLETLRRNGELTWLRPDGKTQVTIEDGGIRHVVVSTQHDERATLEAVRRALRDQIVAPIISDLDHVRLHLNAAGAWHIGGFAADAGLTGRKVMIDTYGGLAPSGGGCFSGKDPTKVDRSAAYLARLAAKTMVISGRAKRCLVSVAYVIGEVDPVMLSAEDESGRDLTDVVKQHFDFRPAAIIERLQLRQPIYRATAAYGHFGRPEFPWERVE